MEDCQMGPAVALLTSEDTMRVVICGGGVIGACNVYIPRNRCP
jgi:hypothetical protein